MRCLLIFLVACSADPTPAQIDAPAHAIDTAPNNCLVDGSYGALGALTGTTGAPAGMRSASMTLDPGPPGKDVLFIKFPDTLAPGSFPITGADANYTTCTVCVTVIADIIAMQGPSKFYFAGGGTVTLASTTPPITGSVANLAFTEISITDGSTIPGCTTSIASADFTSP